MRQVFLFLFVIALLTAAQIAGAQQFQYDSAGRLITATYSDGGSINYEYDANSNQTVMIDANGQPSGARA